MRTDHSIHPSFGRRFHLQGPGLCAAGCALFLTPSALLAQEALQGAIRSDRSYEVRNTPTTSPLENLQLGPVKLGVALSYNVEWVDNVRNVEVNKESDFIHHPQMDMNMAWAPTQESVLRFGAGIGYTKYQDTTELDRLYINPDSELAWDIPYRDFIFTFYDRFDYSQDITSQGALTGVGQFPRFDNTVGFRVSYQPSRYLVQGGYGHQNFWTSDDSFGYLDRSSEQLFGRLAYRFAERTLAGVETSGAFTSYKETVQRDNTSFSAGPFVDWQVTNPFRLTLRGGYVHYSYDPSTLVPAGSDVNGFYLSGQAQHAITDYLRHVLRVTREIRQGLNRGSEYNQIFRPEYVISWSFYKYASLNLNAFYEKGKEPGVIANENYDQKSISVRLGYQLTSKWSTSLGYRYIRRDSELPNRDYSGHSVVLGTSYRF